MSHFPPFLFLVIKVLRRPARPLNVTNSVGCVLGSRATVYDCFANMLKSDKSYSCRSDGASVLIRVGLCSGGPGVFSTGPPGTVQGHRRYCDAAFVSADTAAIDPLHVYKQSKPGEDVCVALAQKTSLQISKDPQRPRPFTGYF